MIINVTLQLICWAKAIAWHLLVKYCQLSYEKSVSFGLSLHFTLADCIVLITTCMKNDNFVTKLNLYQSAFSTDIFNRGIQILETWLQALAPSALPPPACSQANTKIPFLFCETFLQDVNKAFVKMVRLLTVYLLLSEFSFLNHIGEVFHSFKATTLKQELALLFSNPLHWIVFPPEEYCPIINLSYIIIFNL